MTPRDKNGTALLFGQLAILNLLWAPVNLMVRYAQASGFSAAGIGLARWTGISVGLFALLLTPWFRSVARAKWPGVQQALLSILIGLLFIGPAHLLYYVTLAKVSTTEGAVFNTTAPFWVAALAWLVLRERIGPRTWLALVIGGAGTYIVSVGFGLPVLGGTGGHLGFSLLYMLGILLESLGGTLAVYLVRRSSGITIFAFETVGTASAAWIAPLLFPMTLPVALAPVGLGWLPLVYLILGSGILTFGCWYVLSERSPLSLMVVSIALQPPVAAVLGYFFLHETLSTPTAVGSVLVLGALLLAASEPQQKIADPRLMSS